VYFEDGGQVVEPHATGIIERVNAVALKDLPAYLEIDLKKVVVLPDSADEAYRQEAASVVLDPQVFTDSELRVVFSPIHGTAGFQSVPLMKHFGIQFETVEEQM